MTLKMSVPRSLLLGSAHLVRPSQCRLVGTVASRGGGGQDGILEGRGGGALLPSCGCALRSPDGPGTPS